MDEVQNTFRKIAERYDRSRRQLIPCFDRFYGSLVQRVDFPEDGDFSVLDLGAGTGLLTQLLVQRFPRARYTLIDFTAEMLAQARQRFAGEANFRYQVADYAAAEWGRVFDLIVSSLSIHHLEDSSKRTLYRKVFDHLPSGGQFLNAEFVRAVDKATQKQYWDQWLEQMRASGLTEAEVEQAVARTSIDILAPVETQLDWLREIGFTQVECHFRETLFAVFGGRRP